MAKPLTEKEVKALKVKDLVWVDDIELGDCRPGTVEMKTGLILRINLGTTEPRITIFRKTGTSKCEDWRLVHAPEPELDTKVPVIRPMGTKLVKLGKEHADALVRQASKARRMVYITWLFDWYDGLHSADDLDRMFADLGVDVEEEIYNLIGGQAEEEVVPADDDGNEDEVDENDPYIEDEN